MKNQKTFTTFQEASVFAHIFCNEFLTCLNEMNSRQLLGQNIKSAWIIGVNCNVKDTDTYSYRMLREYVNPLRFKEELTRLRKLSKVEIVEYYAYQLTPDLSIIHLENLEKGPCLDIQLKEYSGEGFSSIAYGNEGDLENCSTGGGILVHKKSGQRFFIPPCTIEVCEELNQ